MNGSLVQKLKKKMKKNENEKEKEKEKKVTCLAVSNVRESSNIHISLVASDFAHTSTLWYTFRKLLLFIA